MEHPCVAVHLVERYVFKFPDMESVVWMGCSGKAAVRYQTVLRFPPHFVRSSVADSPIARSPTCLTEGPKSRSSRVRLKEGNTSMRRTRIHRGSFPSSYILPLTLSYPSSPDPLPSLHVSHVRPYLACCSSLPLDFHLSPPLALSSPFPRNCLIHWPSQLTLIMAPPHPLLHWSFLPFRS